MKITKNLGLNMPDEDDFIEIDKINENTEKIDEELAKKADASGGDISETVITTAEKSQAEYPVPAAGDSAKTVMGKVQKFFTDIRNWMTGVCLLGQIVNNCVTNNANLPLSAAQGKVLMDKLTTLNSDIAEKAKTNHASTAKTYGLGSASSYGHVKLSDSYTASGGAAVAGVGASSKAVADAYSKALSSATRYQKCATTFTAATGWTVGNTLIDRSLITDSAARKTGFLSFVRSGAAISTDKTVKVGTIGSEYAPANGSCTRAFSGSNGASGIIEILTDGTVNITPYGQQITQYETITADIYYA